MLTRDDCQNVLAQPVQSHHVGLVWKRCECQGSGVAVVGGDGEDANEAAARHRQRRGLQAEKGEEKNLKRGAFALSRQARKRTATLHRCGVIVSCYRATQCRLLPECGSTSAA